MADEKGQKCVNFFYCKNCDYKTSRKFDFNRHILTPKHKNTTFIQQNTTKCVDFSNNVTNFFCECGKLYAYRSSLYNHKKKCAFFLEKRVKTRKNENTIIIEKNEIIEETSNNEITLSNNLIFKLLNDNKEMREIIVKQQDHMMKQQEQITELIPKIGNNNNNVQNNKFNIQVFLNEQCKDAINMTDFIKSIQVSLEQLDYTKENGLVNGLSNVIIENMNKLGLYQRPIHCTDIKRETLYIKDDNSWEKDVNKQKIKKAIKDVSTKQFCALNNWTKENPDFQNNDNKQNYYTHTLVAIANNKENNQDKIIKKLCNNSYIKED
jgi:hypothetical protein